MKSVALDDYLFSVARRVARNLGNLFYHFTYEEMMGDSATIDRVLEWVGYVSLDGEKSLVMGKCLENCTKTTSDDLRNVIVNYEEIESYLKAEFPCLLLHLHETIPDAVMPSIHRTCKKGLFKEKQKFINHRMDVFRVLRNAA